MRRSPRLSLALLLGFVLFGCMQQGPPPPYTPRDLSLRALPLFFYPSADAGRPARAFVFFFGNDVAFWKPHQLLAQRLSQDGFTVVGLDLRKWLGSLPDRYPERDSAFRSAIGPIIARSRVEVHAESVPVILGGHSFGAEVAFWTAAHAPPPGLVGILAMSPRSSGHLVIVPSDWANHEATGEGSWSTIRLVHDLPPSIRIAIIRGQHDEFRPHDSAFAAAGGERLRRYFVPFAGHSLAGLTLPGPFIDRAMSFLSEPRPAMATTR
ncbi:MAG: lysophospholipase [Gemmatimonadota bacterium]|nr:lysophospholipase [Gemmatimonadota bacterium]